MSEDYFLTTVESTETQAFMDGALDEFSKAANECEAGYSRSASFHLQAAQVYATLALAAATEGKK